jgi:hypothetical protein
MKTATITATPDERPALEIMLRSLKLPTFIQAHAEVADKAESEGWTFTAYLRHLVEMESHDRERRCGPSCNVTPF